MTCPLCSKKNCLTTRSFEVELLSRLWLKTFSFNPFINFPDVDKIDKLLCINCGLIYFSPEIYGDKDFYAKLSVNNWYYESDKWEFDRGLDLIRKYRPKSVLEIGCGSGQFLKKILSGVERVFGLDINEDALIKARQEGIPVSSVELKSLEKSFDMIFMFQVLEHLKDPGVFLSETIKKLNPGGILVLAVPNPDGCLKDMGTVTLDMPPHHNTCWTKEAFSYLQGFLSAKIVIYETESIRYVHYQGLLSNFGKLGTHNKYLLLLQMLVNKLFGPIFYVESNGRIKGQTHLVALQKDNIDFLE